MAIELPGDVRCVLTGLQGRLRGAGAKASWVRAENLHLTMRFLGDIAESDLERLRGGMARCCASHATLRLTLQGTGVFPNRRRPAVVWAGLETLEGDLIGLQAGIEAAVCAAGLPREGKRFHPHVTLARLRRPAGAGRLLGALDREEALRSDGFCVSSVSLFRSTLKPKGAVHTRLDEWGLAPCKQ